MKMKKKGLSHIEIIVSFLLFLVFFLVLLNFFNPLKKSDVNTSLLTILEKGLREENKGSVITSNIILNQSSLASIGQCFSIGDFNQIGTSRAITKIGEERVNSTKKSGRIYIKKQGGNRSYSLLLSDRFSDLGLDDSGCKALLDSDYDLGVTREKEFLFLENFETMKLKYESDYDSVKEDLGFPAENDFVFSLRDYNEKQILSVSRNIPSGIGVLAKDINVEILDINGTVQTVLLNIRVW